MASRRVTEETKTRRPPATTPLAREQQLIALSYDLVEKKLMDGTASSQETTHFLKLGSSREGLEQERLRQENELTAAKRDALAAAGRVEELMSEALKAFRSYSGETPPENFDD